SAAKIIVRARGRITKASPRSPDDPPDDRKRRTDGHEPIPSIPSLAAPDCRSVHSTSHLTPDRIVMLTESNGGRDRRICHRKPADRRQHHWPHLGKPSCAYLYIVGPRARRDGAQLSRPSDRRSVLSLFEQAATFLEAEGWEVSRLS